MDHRRHHHRNCPTCVADNNNDCGSSGIVTVAVNLAILACSFNVAVIIAAGAQIAAVVSIVACTVTFQVTVVLTQLLLLLSLLSLFILML